MQGNGPNLRPTSPVSPVRQTTSCMKSEGKDVMGTILSGSDPQIDSNSADHRTLDLSQITVMISYSNADKENMQMLKGGLEKHGLNVWVDETGLNAEADLAEKGKAIIDSKLFIWLISENTFNSEFYKLCKDEIALAYISDKPIMKIILKKFPCHKFNSKFDENLKGLVEKIREKMKEETVQGDEIDEIRAHAANIEANQQPSTADTFWERHFNKEDKIRFNKFVTAFHVEYGIPLKSMFDGEKDKQQMNAVLQRMLGPNGNVSKDEFIEFCTVDTTFVPFRERLQDWLVEFNSIKGLMGANDMNSTARVKAIHNLGKFKSNFVIDFLLDVLERSNNYDHVGDRVTTAISLAKTKTERKDVSNKLISCLDDCDRLVREAACVALGRLKVKQAVPKLTDRWRHDVISSVREAAQVALGQIGCEGGKQCPACDQDTRSSLAKLMIRVHCPNLLL